MSGSAEGHPSLDPLLLEVIACPSCKGPLTVEDGGLQCAACALAYPVTDGVPVLLVDAAISTKTDPARGDRPGGTGS